METQWLPYAPFPSWPKPSPLTPPLTPSTTLYPSPHTDSPSSRSASPSLDFLSQGGDLSVSSPPASDRAATPKGPLLDYPYRRERFLLVGSVPKISTDAQLKQAFKACGDLLGIYIRFLQKHGIVILAFHDSRQCHKALETLPIMSPSLFPTSDDAPAPIGGLNAQIIPLHSLKSLIGDSQFISDAEAGLSISAPSWVNSVVLHQILAKYGDMSVFMAADYSGTSYVCEFYDSRHAKDVLQALDGNTSQVGVKLQVIPHSILSLPPPPAAYPLPPLHDMYPAPPPFDYSYSIYHDLTPIGREEGHYPPSAFNEPVFIEDDDNLVSYQPPASTTPSSPPSSSLKPDIFSFQFRFTPSLPTNKGCSSPNGGTQSRRCSTGSSAFVPGETTSLERMKALMSLNSSNDVIARQTLNKENSHTPGDQNGADWDGEDLSYDEAMHRKIQRHLGLAESSTSSPRFPSSQPVNKRNVSYSHRRESQRTGGQLDVHLRLCIPDLATRGGEATTTHTTEKKQIHNSHSLFRGPSKPSVDHKVVDETESTGVQQIVYSTSPSAVSPTDNKKSFSPSYQNEHHIYHHLSPANASPRHSVPSPRQQHFSLQDPSAGLSPRNMVDLSKIKSGRDTRTTIMVKNIPSRMTHDDMFEFINKDCPRSFDFLYLRMDFVTGNNVGYAFVNFIEIDSLLTFLTRNLGKKWNMYQSEKVMHVAYATYQGKSALVTKFQNSSILDREDAVQPHIYFTTGPNKGLPETFPPPNDSARKARSQAAAAEHGLYSQLHRRNMVYSPYSSSPNGMAYPPPPSFTAVTNNNAPIKVKSLPARRSVSSSDFAGSFRGHGGAQHRGVGRGGRGGGHRTLSARHQTLERDSSHTPTDEDEDRSKSASALTSSPTDK